MIEEHITRSESDGDIHYIEYCPGDATRYSVMVTRLPADHIEGGNRNEHLLVTVLSPWMKYGSRAYVFGTEWAGPLHISYVNEKLRLKEINYQSFIRTCELIAYALGRELIGVE